MAAAATHEVTQLLTDWQSGNKRALEQLMPLVYRELRKVAASYIKQERSDHTLQPTALIHESYLRMVEHEMPCWQNRAHFFGIAARLMRQILVDYARQRRATKRGSEQIRVSLERVEVKAISAEGERVLVLDAALTKLAKFDQRKSRVLEMRFFGGLTVEETAEVLHVSPDTVKRDWRLAKLWLLREMGGQARD